MLHGEVRKCDWRYNDHRDNRERMYVYEYVYIYVKKGGSELNKLVIAMSLMILGLTSFSSFVLSPRRKTPEEPNPFVDM